MSYTLDSDIQEDVRTFPIYQRLRKINPYAYYSLNTQKQMQSDLRNFGSLTFFEQNIDDIPDVPEPTQSIGLPKALVDAEHMLDTGSPDFNEKIEKWTPPEQGVLMSDVSLHLKLFILRYFQILDWYSDLGEIRELECANCGEVERYFFGV